MNYCSSGGQAAWIACHIPVCSPLAEGNIESSKLTSFEPYWTRSSFQPSLPSFDHVATQNFPPVDLLQMFHPPLWLWELTHLVTSMNLKDGFWTRFHHVFQQELILSMFSLFCSLQECWMNLFLNTYDAIPLQLFFHNFVFWKIIPMIPTIK